MEEILFASNRDFMENPRLVRHIVLDVDAD